VDPTFSQAGINRNTNNGKNLKKEKKKKTLKIRLQLHMELKKARFRNRKWFGLRRGGLGGGIGGGGDIGPDSATLQHEDDIGHGGPVEGVRCCA
jgi:hypothetical protein